MPPKSNNFYSRPDPIGYVIGSIGSRYGHRRGRVVFNRNISVIRKEHAWLKGKRVLILGTGPSAASLSKPLVEPYDFVVLLNHALQFAPMLKAFGIPPGAMGFFSQDKKRIIQASKWLTLSDIPKERCIYVPDFPYSVVNMDLHRIPLTLLSGFIPYLKSYVKPAASGSAGEWHFVYTPVPVDPSAIERAYTRYMEGTSPCPIILPYSGAFTAIPLYSSFRPVSITLIGCDFNGPYFSAHPMEETFTILRSMLRKQGIELENRSSDLASQNQ
jgi:hypothetical protein